METPLKIEFIFILLAAFMVRDYNALRVIGHTEESFETVSAEVKIEASSQYNRLSYER